MTRTTFLVQYHTGQHDHIARFSDYAEAMWFAKSQRYADVIETGKRGGLIGQWRRGVPTGEFPHLAEDFSNDRR